ncbi:hypothetical protein [uncultured Selenomonas sp.]|uniref:hypothetical protein n=1 Tax=uncultured Selenomonas sp. TaxID=159275 RepID=UPI0028EAA3C4|nr:hypothetical protein [uncultured Selenomonas sp.]
MMDINVNSPSDVRAAGMQVLAESLGAVGFTRFIQQFENGWGDYTREKYERKSPTFDELDDMLRAYS